MPPRNDPARRLLVVTESLGVGGLRVTPFERYPPGSIRWSVLTFCLTECGERAEQVEAAGD
jgi:hypothetical protein